MRKIGILAAVLLAGLWVRSGEAKPIDLKGYSHFSGELYSFALHPPLGWDIDSRSGRSQGLLTVFYPSGLSWTKSPVVMYVNVASKKQKGNERTSDPFSFLQNSIPLKSFHLAPTAGQDEISSLSFGYKAPGLF